jgi:hypothetical protein
MGKIRNFWNILLVALTSDMSVSSRGTSSTYLGLFKKKVPRPLIHKIVIVTVTGGKDASTGRTTPALSYCLVEGEKGTLNSFRLKNHQVFKTAAKKYGYRVESFIRSGSAFLGGK